MYNIHCIFLGVKQSVLNVASIFLEIMPMIKSDLPAGGSKIFWKMVSNPEMLTERELEEVTAVFKSFETGLREATIDPKVQALRRTILFIYFHSASWRGRINILQNLIYDPSCHENQL